MSILLHKYELGIFCDGDYISNTHTAVEASFIPTLGLEERVAGARCDFPLQPSFVFFMLVLAMECFELVAPGCVWSL